MNAQLLVPAVAFVGVMAAVLVISWLVGRRAARTGRRLREHAVEVPSNEAKPLERVDILREQNYSSFGVVNALLRRFKPARSAAEGLIRANVDLTVPQYLLARVVVAALFYFVAGRITGIALAGIPAALVGLMLPRIVLWYLARRRRIAFEAQLAEAIDQLVGALRAGYGFLQAIEAAGKEMEDPMRGELMRIMDKVSVGASAVDALQELPQRIASYDLALLVTAVTVQRSAGGNLAEVLQNIAETVRERRRIRAEVRAITTGPRVSSYILGVFPYGLCLWFITTNAAYRQTMLHETIGKYMLGFAALWSFIGFLLSTAVSKVEY